MSQSRSWEGGSRREYSPGILGLPGGGLFWCSPDPPPLPPPPGTALGSMRTVRCGVDERTVAFSRRPRIWEYGRFAPPAPTNESGRPEVSTNESVCPEVSTSKRVCPAVAANESVRYRQCCCLPAYCLPSPLLCLYTSSPLLPPPPPSQRWWICFCTRLQCRRC